VPQVNSITDITDRIGSLQAKSDQRRADIARLEQSLRDRRRALAELPPPVDNKAAIQALELESTELANKVRRPEGARRTDTVATQTAASGSNGSLGPVPSWQLIPHWCERRSDDPCAHHAPSGALTVADGRT
jgi:hypothetical protein